MNKVECIAGQAKILVSRLECSVMLVDIAEVTKNMWKT